MSDKPPFASQHPVSITVPSGFTVQLSQDDFELLLLSTGIALGVCLRDGRKGLALRLTELANTINKNNPRWIPYDTTADERTSPPNGSDKPNSKT
jgi:hypothetical protein